MASCRLPNSPTHSTRDPGGSLNLGRYLVLPPPLIAARRGRRSRTENLIGKDSALAVSR